MSDQRGAGSENLGGARLRSAMACAYLAALFVLLSGFFHSAITGAGFAGVAAGVAVLSVGTAGGVLLYRTLSSGDCKATHVAAGFGLLAASLYLIFALVMSF